MHLQILVLLAVLSTSNFAAAGLVRLNGRLNR